MYISNWVGFAFGILSLIFSIFTLFIIYRMAGKQRQSISQTNGDNNKNPLHEAIYPSSRCDIEKASNPDLSRDSLSFIIKNQTKFNGYLLIIVCLTCCQALYDIGYILAVVYEYNICVLYHFLDVVGGLGVTLWTNILSFIIYYVVTYIRSVVSFRILKSIIVFVNDFVP